MEFYYGMIVAGCWAPQFRFGLDTWDASWQSPNRSPHQERGRQGGANMVGLFSWLTMTATSDVVDVYRSRKGFVHNMLLRSRVMSGWLMWR